MSAQGLRLTPERSALGEGQAVDLEAKWEVGYEAFESVSIKRSPRDD